MRNITILLFLITLSSFSQTSKIFERLVALDNNGKIWYNIDGYSVTSEKFNISFDEKGLKKVFKKHNIKDSDVKIQDDSIKYKNIVIYKTEKLNDKVIQRNSYYFLENKEKKITVIWFAKTSDPDLDMHRELVQIIIDNKIPNENFVSMQTNTINFGNRKIELGNSCYWTFLNTVQCPYFGEMNWSVHKTLDDASKSIINQFENTNARKMGSVRSEEFVDVEFEGVETKAKKVILDIKGVAGLAAGMSGGKYLTIYYVAEKVRDNYMSCVMSFWNNDQVNPETKLPPLLEKVMKLK
jgi:hypothetical protein